MRRGRKKSNAAEENKENEENQQNNQNEENEPIETLDIEHDSNDISDYKDFDEKMLADKWDGADDHVDRAHDVEMWTQSDNKQFDEREYIEAEADKIIHAEVDDLFRRGDAHGYINEQHQQRQQQRQHQHHQQQQQEQQQQQQQQQ